MSINPGLIGCASAFPERYFLCFSYCRFAAEPRFGGFELGLGPILHRGPNMNPTVAKQLVQTAKSKKIAYQMMGAPRGTGTDANAMQLSRAGVATALVGIPNRYMHSPVEIVSLNDVERAAP